MIPGLEDRLMEGSEDDVLSMAALVSHSLDFNVWLIPSLCSFRRVYPVPGQMTWRAWRVAFLTGLYHLASLSHPHSHGMSKWIVAFTMSTLVPCDALLEWTGPTSSKHLSHCRPPYFIFIGFKESERSYAMAIWLFQEISGQLFCMLARILTPKIYGKICLRIPFWSP